MNRPSPKALLLAAFLLVAAAALLAIRGHERTLAEGRIVLAALAPVDPRSLMQGDYMALRFAIDEELPRWRQEAGAERIPAFAYLALDSIGTAKLAGLGDTPATPSSGQVAMRIRWRGGQASIGPNAYFFEEGAAGRYAAARWGEFRVNARGTALLTHLRDVNLEQL